MSTINPSLVENIAAQHHLRRGSGRWAGPCPKCGGSTRSDKFVLRDDGGFKCYACDFKGDVISWLREMEGLSCPDAHDRAGLPCRSASCAVRGTCRLGDGSGKKTARPGRRSVTVSPPVAARPLPTARPTDPAELWLAWAEKCQQLYAQVLPNHDQAMAWLATRGISRETAIAAGLGWREHDSKVVRAEIGLPPKDGKDKLWVPGGLVIPTWSSAQDEPRRLLRLRIRRSGKDRVRFLPDLKYVWIEGSGSAPMYLPAQAPRPRGVVVVEAELDGLAVAAAHPDVAVIALGTVSAGLPADLAEELRRVPVILVALDIDVKAERGGSGAGQKAVELWKRAYRQARHWPPPQGKDPGEYAELGGDLHLWIEAGLPPRVGSAPAGHDSSLCPVPVTRGERGEDCQGVRIITLVDGRDIHVTADRVEYDALVNAGKIAFSENELARLQVATAGMTAREREHAALLTVDIKETMAGAYIRAG